MLRPAPLATLSLLAALTITLPPVYAAAGHDGGLPRDAVQSTTSRSAPHTPGEIVHVVGKGQTLGRIAKRYHVSVEALREANGLRPGQRIRPGLELRVPSPDGDAPSREGAHTATAGRAHDGGSRRTPRVAADPPAFHGRWRKGMVRLIRGTDTLEVQTLTRHGHLAPAALAGFSQILRFYPTGAKLPIDPRLAALVGQVSDHFGGKPIHVVSGFRPYSPAQYTPHSNHNVGRAMDFSVEGVPNTVVRDFCRTFRNAGVGYYPNSTFVHLDVRAGKAYWVDYSRPGEAPHYDSPGSQQSADESTGDVEPHPTPADASPGSMQTP